MRCSAAAHPLIFGQANPRPPGTAVSPAGSILRAYCFYGVVYCEQAHTKRMMLTRGRESSRTQQA